jgi:hypothetical protein
MRTLTSCLVLTLALACGDKDTGDSDTATGGDDSGDTDSDDTAVDTGEDPITGTIEGTITVELVTTAVDGAREQLAWEDSSYWDGSAVVWPYGKIFVGAYYTGDGGGDHYVGSDVVHTPDDSNPYSLDYSSDGDQSVWVYASIDKYADRIVGSSDPRGVYPIEVPITDGDAITSVDITVLVSPFSGGGGGGGGCSGAITVTGDAEVTVNYASGDVATMLVGTGGDGPWTSDIGTPTATATGAEQVYTLNSCPSLGQGKVVGAWDRNNDTMFAPDDTWGTYVLGGVDANPVTIGGTNLSGVDVEIPFGDEPGVTVVPFVQLSGTVSVNSGAFDDLPAGTTVYVSALKYRPTGGFDITTTDAAYDTDSFEWPDLTGETSKDFSLTVPAGTTAYLWAYADVDVDGMVNESGEPVASGGIDDNGRVETGTSSQTGIGLPLGPA